MAFKRIWIGVDWELLIDDNDTFKIQDNMTGDSITIEDDDKAEFRQLLENLAQELDEEEDFTEVYYDEEEFKDLN